MVMPTVIKNTYPKLRPGSTHLWEQIMTNKNNDKEEFYNPDTIDKDTVKSKQNTWHNRTSISNSVNITAQFEKFSNATIQNNSREERKALAESRNTRPTKKQ